MSELDGCAGHGGVVADESMPTRLIPRPEMDPPVDGAISGADSTHTEAFARARARTRGCDGLAAGRHGSGGTGEAASPGGLENAGGEADHDGYLPDPGAWRDSDYTVMTAPTPRPLPVPDGEYADPDGAGAGVSSPEHDTHPDDSKPLPPSFFPASTGRMRPVVTAAVRVCGSTYASVPASGTRTVVGPPEANGNDPGAGVAAPIPAEGDDSMPQRGRTPRMRYSSQYHALHG